MHWLALCLVLVAGDAFGGEVYKNGNELLAHCTAERKQPMSSTDYMDDAHCVGYLTAIHDGYATWRGWGDISSDQYCMPDGVTVGQLGRIVVKWLEANPEHLHYSAGTSVLNAYQEAFPCE